MNPKISKKIIVCLTLYIVSLFAANTLGIKLMPFLFGTHLSVAVFSFPIVFCMTDVIGEVYGKKMANNFVLAGVLSILLFLLYSLISNVMPWAYAGLWVKDGYNQIFGLSVRFSVASLVAFAIGQYQDVISFFFLKEQSAKNISGSVQIYQIFGQNFSTLPFLCSSHILAYYQSKLLS